MLIFSLCFLQAMSFCANSFDSSGKSSFWTPKRLFFGLGGAGAGYIYSQYPKETVAIAGLSILTTVFSRWKSSDYRKFKTQLEKAEIAQIEDIAKMQNTFFGNKYKQKEKFGKSFLDLPNKQQAELYWLYLASGEVKIVKTLLAKLGEENEAKKTLELKLQKKKISIEEQIACSLSLDSLIKGSKKNIEEAITRAQQTMAADQNNFWNDGYRNQYLNNLLESQQKTIRRRPLSQQIAILRVLQKKNSAPNKKEDRGGGDRENKESVESVSIKDLSLFFFEASQKKIMKDQEKFQKVSHNKIWNSVYNNTYAFNTGLAAAVTVQGLRVLLTTDYLGGRNLIISVVSDGNRVIVVG